MEGIGKKIKKRRMELNMSAETLAEKLNVNPSTIYRYESKGIDNMRIDKVLPIAKALNVSASYLIGWDEDDSSSTIHQNKSEFIKDNSDTIENLTKEMMDKIVNLETLYMDDGKSEIDAEDREDLAIGIEAAVTAALLAYKKRKG